MLERVGTLRWRQLVVPVCLVVATGCVTINVYFPAAAAEKAADKIIEEVWQTKQGQTSAPPPKQPTQPKKQ